MPIVRIQIRPLGVLQFQNTMGGLVEDLYQVLCQETGWLVLWSAEGQVDARGEVLDVLVESELVLEWDWGVELISQA